jgi:hypothetical protein
MSLNQNSQNIIEIQNFGISKKLLIWIFVFVTADFDKKKFGCLFLNYMGNFTSRIVVTV